MNSSDERRYDFDAMRASMMLLGIVFHACVSFIVTDTGNLWPFQSERTHLVFDVIVGTLHAFRIPAFFMISGFFVCRQLSRHPWSRVILKRFRRVLVPFIVCMLFIAPIVQYGFYSLMIDVSAFTKDSFKLFISHWHSNTVHFWFLYYLILFHIMHLILYKIQGLFKRMKRLSLVRSLIIMLSCQFCIVLFFGLETIDGDYHLIPRISSLLYYFTFYLFGHQIFNHIKIFDRWITNAKWIYIAAALVNTSYLLVSQESLNTEISEQIILWKSLISVINSTLLILATFRFFHTLFSKKSTIVHYFSKASYLIYIVHLPILIWTLAWLSKWIENPFILVLCLISITSLLSIILYQLQQKYWKSLL